MKRNKKYYCDDCYTHKDRLTIATHIQEPDPYREEIHDDLTPVDLCDECYDEALENI